jgi:hypothetical protein
MGAMCHTQLHDVARSERHQACGVRGLGFPWGGIVVYEVNARLTCRLTQRGSICLDVGARGMELLCRIVTVSEEGPEGSSSESRMVVQVSQIAPLNRD